MVNLIKSQLKVIRMNRILFQIVDIFGNIVELTEERWETHILTGH